MESCGRVVIEDFVEIGAGCTIDRGVSHDTIIGRGTKMDNMIHIGHDYCCKRKLSFCGAGRNCRCDRIGKGVVLWGQVGVSKTLTIGDNAVLYAQTGAPSSLEGNKAYLGSPAEDATLKKREFVWIKRIPRFWKKVM